MKYQPLNERDPNLCFRPTGMKEEKPAYVVRVPRSEQHLVEETKKLIEEKERLYQQENAGLLRIHFDRHLYQPLLVEMPEKAQMVPPGLKESEARFVRDLREYWDSEKDKTLAGKEIFLLRNLSRGRGVGFFEESGFYPDFILWVLYQKTDVQRLIFIEPHGLMYAKAYKFDNKARLHEKMPVLTTKFGNQSGQNNVTLDAFIISATPYEDLSQFYDDGTWDRAKFTEKHILFPERGTDYDYMKLLLG